MRFAFVVRIVKERRRAIRKGELTGDRENRNLQGPVTHLHNHGNPNSTTHTKYIGPTASRHEPALEFRTYTLACLVISGLAHYAIPAAGIKSW